MAWNSKPSVSTTSVVPGQWKSTRSPPALPAQLGVAERIDAAMDHQQLPRLDALVDDRLGNAEPDERSTGDDAVRARGLRRDDAVVGTLTGHIPVEVTGAQNSPPPGAPGVRAATASVPRP
jgi:hypothetical protein